MILLCDFCVVTDVQLHSAHAGLEKARKKKNTVTESRVFYFLGNRGDIFQRGIHHAVTIKKHGRRLSKDFSSKSSSWRVLGLISINYGPVGSLGEKAARKKTDTRLVSLVE